MYSTFLSRVGQSWSELLQLFKPKNFKKYLYITIKSYFQTLKALLKGGIKFLLLSFFLWIITAPIILFLFAIVGKDLFSTSNVWSAILLNKEFFSISSFFIILPLLSFIYWLSYWLLIFLCVAAARSSTAKKDHYYFLEVLRKNFRYFVVLVGIVAISILGVIAFFNYFNAALLKRVYYILFLVSDNSLGLVLNPMIIFGTLLLIDSSERNRFSLIFTSPNKNKLIWYTYPLTGLLVISFYQLYFFFERITGKLIIASPSSSFFGLLAFLIPCYLILFLGVPLYITMLTNIYLQQMHEHYDWYHEKK